ncbi:beta-1,3-galactosyltransferase 1-like [Physella acuta]|uniref:beta-1,3-galactosyltransferase 1-like n=1 Tax=Physella acuta TaxID=109671 RepID=UPI0027DBF2D6|nr:beta-1,3-galactosyltransferase 1-like [Physella acuta]
MEFRSLPKTKYVKIRFILTFALATAVLYTIVSDISFLPIFSRADIRINASYRNKSYHTFRIWTESDKNNRTKWRYTASKNFTKTLYSEQELSKFPFLAEKVINPHNYKHVISPSVTCKDQQEIEIIICVSTRFDNFASRQTIRETWGSYANVSSHNSILIFFIGQRNNSAPNASLTQKSFLYESVMYGDILQEDYLDCYNNLTLKSVSILKYVSIHCFKRAKYILKADDDMYINVPYLVTSLKQLQAKKPNLDAFVMGIKHTKPNPNRSTDSKWYISISEFPEDNYPDYVSGGAYVMSTQAAWLLYQASLRLPLFRWEDVYITGMCSKKAGVEVLDSELFSYSKYSVSGCSFRERISGHPYSPDELRQIHSELNNRTLVCT